jgi:septal ring-binding cell division protein DamX
MAADRRAMVLASGALLIAATLALGGCSTTIADLPAVGTPADAPERPKEPGAYLPVHDLPPDRVDAVISPAERAKIETELVAARERQATATETKDGKAKPEPKPAAKSKSGARSEAKSEPKSRSKAEAKAE